MELTKSLVTYDDYLTLPADGKRYEIIEGELFMTPAPTTDHQDISARLFDILYRLVLKNNLGTVFYAPTDVVFSMTEVVQPDIIFIRKERKEIITKRNIVAAPDLVIEIISESTAVTDRTTKKALYERHGVKEYWIVDPDAKTIECFVLKQDKFEQIGSHSGFDTLASCLLPELKLPVQEVFPK